MFYHRLAARLGRTVPELLATTTSMELTNWAAYYVHEPWGNEWAMFAKLAAWVAATGGHKTPEDVERTFAPVRYEREVEEEPPQSEEEIREQLAKVAAFFNKG